MKKAFSVWVIVILIVLMVSSVAQAAPLGTRALSLGLNGEDVEELQLLLKQLGYFNTSVTSYYGNITRQSVLDFQAAHNLSVDGMAGPETIHRLKYENGVAAESYIYIRNLRKGLRGGDVQNLQEVLKRLGYLPSSLNTTLYFGEMTDAGVRAFQRKMNLTVDGSVGPATSSTLNNVLNLQNNSGGTDKSDLKDITYIVQPGDTLWEISQKYNTTIVQIKETNGLNNDIIYVGQQLFIAFGPGHGADNKPSISYNSYTVKAGDTIWSIANKNSITQSDLLKANGFNTSTVLYIGQIIKIPVFSIPVKSTPGPQYGEYLDWWTEAQYVLPFNVPFKVTDFYTGTSFTAVRTFGANHADCEPLTSEDTRKIKNLWDTYHSSYWTSRPIIISVNGRKLAASMSAMFHAGVDTLPNGEYVKNRSGGYGYGQNFDAIKGNSADGHFDIHFKNSTTHNTGTINSAHQLNTKISSGFN